MKVVFLSSYYNHHQQSFSLAMYRLCKNGFYFIQTKQISKERKILGYSDYVSEKFVLSLWKEPDHCKKLIDSADILIVGSAPESLIKNRVRSGKTIFRYSERPLKNGMEPLKYFPRLIRWNIRNPFWKPIYLLCASAYTSADFSKFGLFRNKAFKWGYFPETKKYNIDELIQKKNKNCILWCGRFLDWKHPDDVIRVAERLKNNGYDFEINFIGMGPMEQKLRQMTMDLSLESRVHFLGSMKPEQVRMHMEAAGIYLFTSDRQEGWGAVLNESMNSGCSVVASHAIGSVPYLLKNGENGLIYKSGDIDMLYEKVAFLLDHHNDQERFGSNAYNTIVKSWNAEEAAKRLIHLFEYILDNRYDNFLYLNGPCSYANLRLFEENDK